MRKAPENNRYWSHSGLQMFPKVETMSRDHFSPLHQGPALSTGANKTVLIMASSTPSVQQRASDLEEKPSYCSLPNRKSFVLYLQINSKLSFAVSAESPNTPWGTRAEPVGCTLTFALLKTGGTIDLLTQRKQGPCFTFPFFFERTLFCKCATILMKSSPPGS